VVDADMKSIEVRFKQEIAMLNCPKVKTNSGKRNFAILAV